MSPTAAPLYPAEPRRRSRGLQVVLMLAGVLLMVLFLALGSWQVQRLGWKLDLIERVEQRVHAPATPAPGPAQWPQITARSDEYRHVSLRGQFLYDKTSLVQASTVRGAGFWVLTPLRTAGGEVVFVNRGFVPQRAPVAETPATEVEVQGLLRLSEPGGGFLRHNDPGAQRWYSRDVQALAQAHGLSAAAPYFIDADASAGDLGQSGAGEDAKPGEPQQPVAGLTVVNFTNNHLVYALTWFALALMVAGAMVYAWRQKPTPT
ncbi:SURF1 family protein [Curvibacter gracilis]|uniref:SURF1 family protein n=1 Tax=Curvibacter gracilis TaxID=230310 RepID=UPI0004801E4C|nr:SURF1 family protein [Curvibacter gracilis]